MRRETDSAAATRIRIAGHQGPETVTTGDMFPHDMTAPPDMADLLESIIEWAVELLRVDDGVAGAHRGVLGFNVNPVRRSFDQDDVRLAILVANLAAVAIENARLYEALQDRAEKRKWTLEQEVAKRTTELAHRALQLETSAQVSREITSILEVDTLSSRVVDLISETFDYYHVFIFLVDEGRVLRHE